MPSGSALHLAVIGAFPFPLPRGSQVFVRDQIRALHAAGVDTTLVCYGSRAGTAPDDLRVVRVPRALSPSALRAGPSPFKPLADAALAIVYARAHRARRFDPAGIRAPVDEPREHPLDRPQVRRRGPTYTSGDATHVSSGLSGSSFGSEAKLSPSPSPVQR